MKTAPSRERASVQAGKPHRVRSPSRQTLPRISENAQVDVTTELNDLLLGHLRHVGADQALVTQLQMHLAGPHTSEGSKLHQLVAYSLGGSVDVVVSGLTGHICCVRANAADSVRRLKELIELETAIPVCDQVLVRKTQTMEDTAVLFNFNISPAASEVILVKDKSKKLYVMGYSDSAPSFERGLEVAAFDIVTQSWTMELGMEHADLVAKVDRNFYKVDGNNLEVWIPDAGKWEDLPVPLLGCYDYRRLLAVGSKLYVLGCDGCDGNDDQRGMFAGTQVFDTTSSTWTRLPNMSYDRQCFECAVLNDRIYAVGGSEDDEDTDVAEVLDVINAGTWMTLPPLSTPRRGFELVALADRIYAVGGDGLASAEVFDPAEGHWRALPPMSTPRFTFGAVTVDNKLYVIGGADRDDKVLASVEVFDPVANAWAQLASMSQPRLGIDRSVVSYRDRLYVLGGYSDRFYVLGEVFDITSNTWSPLPECEQVPSHRFGCHAIAM